VNIKYILTGFVALVIIIAGVLLISTKGKIVKVPVPSASPSIQKQIESKFKGLTIPADTERIELKDVSGGSSMGIATKNEILADLPDLAKGQFYQVWLRNSSGKLVLIGTLKMEKGGWLLNYDLAEFPGYNNVIIMQGFKHILEGSF
jgi:hypothetical protein